MAGPERFDADPDPTFHTDADPGTVKRCDSDIDPTQWFRSSDPDPGSVSATLIVYSAYYFN